MASTSSAGDQSAPAEGSATSQPQPELCEFDWLTNMALLHLDFVFQKFLWRDYPESPEVQHSWKNLQEGIEKTSENYPNLGVLFNGEYASETCVPPKLFVSRSTGTVDHRAKNNILVKDNTNRVVPAEATIKVKTNVATPGYVQVEVVPADGASEVVKYRHLAGVWAEMDKMVTDINHALQKENMESACSLCIPVEKWPEDPDRWPERAKAHNWPDPDIIEGLMVEGCFLTPRKKPGQTFGANDNEAVTWRYCFPSQEIGMQALLNATMRRVLALFYLIMDDDLLLSSVLTKEHVRMELYTTVQKLGEGRFVEENIGWCFLALVDTIFHDLIMNKIPNYFYPACNMIEGVEDDFISDARKIVSRIRRNPTDYLFKFEASKRLTCMPAHKTVKEITSPIFKMQCGIEMSKVMYAMYVSLKFEIVERLRNNEFEAAKVAAEEAAPMLEKFSNHRRSPGGILCDEAYNLEDTTQAARIMERVVEELTDASERGYLLGNLGCMYYGQACRMEDGPERDKVLEKMEKVFRERLSNMDCQPATKLDYYNIICSQKRYGEALPLLKLFVKDYATSSGGNMYDKHEVNTLDDNLKMYIENGQSVHVHSVAYAFYLLARCYRELGPAEMEEDFWDRFTAVCTAAALDGSSQLSFTLLGLALQGIGETDRAQAAFLQALQTNKDDLVAKLFTESTKSS